MIGYWISKRLREVGITIDYLATETGIERNILEQIASDQDDDPEVEYLQKIARVLGDPSHPPGATIIAPRDASLALGDFVFRPRDGLGIGKITEIQDDRISVEYFSSVAEREIVEHLSVEVARTEPSQETRCYFEDPQSGTWKIGRVDNFDRINQAYLVMLPDMEYAEVPKSDLFVRCDIPVDDPTSSLVMKLHETAFFHTRRRQFANSIFKQRSMAKGLTALISSNIILYDHQVNIIRRVLQDPIQRYLLADEVGLGKTIEAGVILRQFLLDEKGGRALIIVPSNLKAQWRGELSEKFNAFDISGRVVITEPDHFEEMAEFGEYGMVIIDEAQHVAALGNSDEQEKRERYSRIAALTSAVPRLLLLSATPVLNNQPDFLAMLHLMDPQLYSMDKIDRFEQQIEKRADIGSSLLIFEPDAPEFLIKECINDFRAKIGGGLVPEEMLVSLEEELATGGGKRNQLIREIRTYIGETLRLHRRLLRTRRSELPEGFLIARQTDSLSLSTEMEFDSRTLSALDAIDAWREDANGHLSTVGFAGGDYRKDFELIFQALIEGSGSCLEMLGKVARARLGQSTSENLSDDLAPALVRALNETPLFPNEGDHLKAISSLSEQELRTDDTDKFDVLLDRVRTERNRAHHTNKQAKIVVFSSHAFTRRKIVQHLSEALGGLAVCCHGQEMSSGENEGQLSNFKNNNDSVVLVCDQSAEEGRNFQFSDTLIHFDLPLSPNRIEQRIGRLDRIGRDEPLRSVIFLGPISDSSMTHIHEAWFTILRDGFGIFKDSIASLQFFVDRKLPDFIAKLFMHGSDDQFGLLADINLIQSEIKEEQIANENQHVLDEIDFSSEGSLTFCHDLRSQDTDTSDFESRLDPWISEALNFEKINLIHRSSVRYSPTKRTLIPNDLLLNRIMPYSGMPVSYDRAVCVDEPGIRIMRVGNQFLDALDEYIQWDDRGKAFAIWRCYHDLNSSLGDPVLAFWFSYHIRLNMEGFHRIPGILKDSQQLKSLRRQGDWFFPPESSDQVVDTNGIDISNQDIRSRIAHPFDGPGRRTKFGIELDINLHRERVSIIDSLIPVDQWGFVCRTVRESSERHIREDSSFKARLESAASNTRQFLSERKAQLDARRLYESNNSLIASVPDSTILLDEQIAEAFVSGILHPEIRVDSVGFVALSAELPALNVGP